MLPFHLASNLHHLPPLPKHPVETHLKITSGNHPHQDPQNVPTQRRHKVRNIRHGAGTSSEVGRETTDNGALDFVGYAGAPLHT